MIGGCSADDLVGRRPAEVMPPPWAEALAGPFRRVLDSDRVRAERGLQLLFDVGEALDATLGVEERLARLAALVVPTLGDFCTIEMLEASGEARRVAGAPLPEGAAADSDRLIAVPLRARGRDHGTLTLRMGPSGRSYDDADRALALQLGRRAGLAVDNARLYDLFAAGRSWVAVIGDVCGKGVEAAALTSLARHSMEPLGRPGTQARSATTSPCSS